MAYHLYGKAIFSTHNGEYARREKTPGMRIILRSNPVEDQQTMVSKLQKAFPEACKGITRPVMDMDVYEYFDYCDAEVQGFEFLRAVLDYIARLNERINAEKTLKVQDYVRRWKTANSEAFRYIRPYHAINDLFTKEDIEEQGIEFLMEAMMQIKGLRMQEDNDQARQSALRLQMQHAQTVQNRRNFTPLPPAPAPARPLFSINVSAQSMRAKTNPRATSNPESGLSRLQEGPFRRLPGSPGQISAPQSHLPLQRLTPSTEVLEHIHPGSTSRGDYHSDPTAHNAMDNDASPPPDNYIAIPSRGLPGPFTYRPLPPSTQSVPLLDRVEMFDGNLPKGKKNPQKKSSDDARIVSNTGNGPLHASHGANNQRPFTLQNIPPPFYSQSPEATPSGPDYHPNSATVPFSGDVLQANLPQSHTSGDRQETVHRPPYSGQMPMQPAMGGRSRVMTNPYAQPAHELQGPMQDPRPAMLTLSIPQNLQHQERIARGHLFEEHSCSLSTQVRPHFPQPLEPPSLGHQLPDRRIEAEDRRTPDLENQRPAVAPISNAGQSPTSGISGRSLAKDTPRRSVPEGCTIWIGGIPQEFDKAAVMHLLRPCRGLVYVSKPKISQTSRDTMKRSYVFADFQNSVDAAEALERLPQTRFADLPDGTFLNTNYARSPANSSPRHQQRGGEEQRKWPGFNISPSKSRTGEDPARAGNPKTELGRNSSEGSGRGKKATASSFDGDSRRPSERVIAVDADHKASHLQPEEASTSLLPHGRAESMVYVSQPSADSQQGIKPMNRESTVVQPDVGVEPYANDGSTDTGDGAREITSPVATKAQVQDNHQGPGLKRHEGHTKSSKKKSRNSKRLPVPETKAAEPHLVKADFTISKPTKPAEPSTSDINKVPKNNLEDKGKQSTSEVEASTMTAPTQNHLDPGPTLPKDLNTPDQSFLDCNPTEVDGEHPKASVAYVAIHSNAKDGEAKVSQIAPISRDPAVRAAPPKRPEDPMSEAMRDNSTSRPRSVDTMVILHSTAPPSSSQIDCSNSLTDETLPSTIRASHLSSESPQASKASGLGEIASDKKAEYPKGLVPSRTGLKTSYVQEGLTTITNRESVELRPSLVKVDVEKGSNLPLIQPSSSKSNREVPKSPVRKRAPSIPPRSSSLAAPSTPIKTHQKKKPRILTPIGEAPSEDHLGCLTKVTVDCTKIVPNKLAMGSTKIAQPILKIDPAACALTAESLKDLPKPETPFLTDDGVRMAPPMINRHTVGGASNSKRYYELKRAYQISHLGSDTHVSATSDVIDFPGSTSPQSSDTSMPDRALTKEQTNDLVTTLREAGFRCLSDSSPFPVKTPELAFFEVIEREENSLETYTNKGGPMVSWIDDSGKLGPGMTLDALIKQNEILEVVKKAAAVKRLLAGPPPWTKIEYQRKQLSRWITDFVTSSQEQQIVKLKAHRTLMAKPLLDTIPRRDSSTTELQEWSTKVSRFMEENASGSSPTYGQSRKRATNSPSKSTRCTPLQQEQQERRHRVLINKPDPQVLACEPSRNDFALQSLDTEFSDTLTTGQITESELSPSTFGRRTPSEERPTTSVALVHVAPFNQINKLDDLFVGMRKEQRRWSDDCQRFCTSQEEDRMTKSDHGIQPLDAEFDVLRVTEMENVEPESETKDIENGVRQTPRKEKHSESTSKELGEGEGDQNIPAKSDRSKDHTPAESKQDAPAKAENPKHQKHIPRPLGASGSSFDSSVTTSNEGSSEEARRNQPRGGHNPLGRSSYNSVAGRGTDAKRGKGKDGSQDPWALPQGEKAWGRGGKGRGEKKRRQRK
ncbi:hypothetical protein BDR22DRAFT_889792 [Usnea florida]